MAKETNREAMIEIEALRTGRISPWLVGITPLILNSMSAKTLQTLLMPRKKTAADKAQNLKHEPLDEYRSAPYKRTGTGPTRIVFPAAAFKGAMCNAALEIPGAKKSQIGRLVWVEGDYLDVYGVPELLMSVVRSADMNKTPDVRTRAIIRKWAIRVPITFVQPTLNATSIIQLLSTAGLVIGVGDFRQEKGKGNYGQFQVCNEGGEYEAIVKSGGMKAQDAALETPKTYDEESRQLLEWFLAEKTKRGHTTKAT